MTAVAIHNADGQVLGRCSLRHAIGMIVREVAQPYEWDEERTFGPYPFVTAVILVAAKYVYPKWLDKSAPFSSEALRLRDRYTCCYCDKYGDEVEHIQPKSRGGRLEWLNCVVACRDCNGKKGDRTPQEAGMRLLREPWVPTVRDLRKWQQERRHRR